MLASDEVHQQRQGDHRHNGYVRTNNRFLFITHLLLVSASSMPS
jgi:hypothetical protein